MTEHPDILYNEQAIIRRSRGIYWEIIVLAVFMFVGFMFLYYNVAVGDYNLQKELDKFNFTSLTAADVYNVYQNFSYINCSFENSTYINQTYLNQTFLNQSFFNETYLEQTFINQTFVNETYLTQNLINNTYVNQTLISTVEVLNNDTENNSTI